MNASKLANRPDSLTWSLQALLTRHESYVADAERERARMTLDLGEHESAINALEADNGRLTAENEALVGQVDGLHAAVQSSETHIDNLTATLHSTQHEMQRLAVLASRAQHLEAQLTQLEAEQARLQSTLITTQAEERMAMQRWRESERALADLSSQMEQIEKEAAEERQRHAEVVERLERRTTVEKELGSAALRLKSAAGQDSRANNEVVTNFVKEILSDNATLQLSMVELQDLLASSRDEMEILRDQLADARADSSAISPFRPGQPLSRELPQLHERNQSSELHVHHHYHAPQQTAPASAARNRVQIPARSRRKKSSQSSRAVSPGGRAWSPQRYSRMHSNNGSVSSVQRPGSPRRSKRWSSNSIQTQSSVMSSGPSSPRSASVAPSTIFERAFPDDGTVYSATEYSCPSSPESASCDSPELRAAREKIGLEEPAPLQSFSLPSPGFALSARLNEFEPVQEEDESLTLADHADITLSPGVTITRGSPSRSPARASVRSPARSPTRSPLRGGDSSRPPTRLRRKTSQSSLYSISGMDIHSSFTPASPTRAPTSSYKRPAALHRAGPSSYQHTGPILTAATAQAKAERERYAAGMGRALLENLAPGQSSKEDKDATYRPLADTFGRGWKVGGWLSGRWKGSLSSGDLRAAAEEQKGRPDTAGGLERVDEDDADLLRTNSGEGEGSSKTGDDSESKRNSWHNEEAQQRQEAIAKGAGKDKARTKELPAGKMLKRANRSVLQSELDEASLRECLGEDVVV